MYAFEAKDLGLVDGCWASPDEFYFTQAPEKKVVIKEPASNWKVKLGLEDPDEKKSAADLVMESLLPDLNSDTDSLSILNHERMLLCNLPNTL